MNQDVKQFHAELIAAARKRNEKERDIEDPAEFEDLVQVLEEIGVVAIKASEKGMKPVIVGRALQYYAKCIGVGLVKPTLAPEAK